MSVANWRSSTQFKASPYQEMIFFVQEPSGARFSGLRRRAHIIGVSVSDTTAEIRIATARVTANSRNRRPTTSPMKSSGISTAISEKVSEMMVKPISREPFSAASSGGTPASMWRAMFSITTIASSTTKPAATTSAISVRLLIEKPARYMTPKVPISESGTATLGMSVAEIFLRKTKMTATTSTTAIARSICTSCTEARMVTVRSVSTATSIDAGSAAWSCGSWRLMRSTVSITLAPGCRWMLRITAGTSFIHAARREFSAPSTTSATSDRKTGAPLR
jgi:hypothetical protein